MNKTTIMPQVVVYRDIFSEEDLNLLMNEIQKSELNIDGMDYALPEDSAYFDKHGPQPENRNDGSLIYTWTPWYTFGSRSIWSNIENQNDNSLQAAGFRIIKNAISIVHLDYIKNWSKENFWNDKINDWNLSDNDDEFDPELVLSTIEILKHRINNDSDYTIHPHTDSHEHRAEEPGPKHILTYTIYLNDDYKGGEVDFVDEHNKHLIAYKPKRGDITVFPSGLPFWHGARAAYSGSNKIFLRTFLLYRYGGSKRWLDGIRNHGVTRWLESENKEIKKILDEGNVGRQIVRPGEEARDYENLVPLYITQETYIDGREL